MKMLMGGEWIEKEKKLPVKNPFNGQTIDEVPQGENEDVDKAIRYAKEGFKIMRNLPAYKRSQILERTAHIIKEKTEEFAHTISCEVGKTIKEARREVSRAIFTFSVAAEEAKRIGGEIVPFDAVSGAENKFGFSLRVPVGIITAISPFNFPLNLAAHKVAPALAAGNAVILKPSTLTPLADLKMGEALLEAGLPGEALSIVTGSGNKIGKYLVSHPEVRMVTFTGSAQVGKEIIREGGLKKVTLELGANCAVIITKDANLEEAAAKVLTGGFAVAGQVCISVQRVLVEEEILKDFLSHLLPLVKKIKVGDPLQEDTDMGPVISEEAAYRIEQWIKEAKEKGAEILYGGERKGTLFAPTVLYKVTPDMKVFSEEAFAPLIGITTFRTHEEAIELANNSRYGLQAGIFTKDISTAFNLTKELEVGGVIINDVPTFRVDHMPYGGVKESGLGREGVKYAIEEMTEIKLICFNL